MQRTRKFSLSAKRDIGNAPSRLAWAKVLAGVLASVAAIIGVVGALMNPSGHDNLHANITGSLNQSFQNINGNITTSPLLSNDPREMLARSGKQWSRGNFQEALNDDDERSAALFLDGGMKLSQGEFISLVGGDFRTHVAALLTSRKNDVEPDVCPTRGPFWSIYENAKSDTRKVALIRQLCAREEVRTAIRTELATLDDKFKKSQIQNSMRGSVVKACVGDMQRFGIRRLLDEAEHTKFMADTTFTPKDAVEAEIHQILIVGIPQGNWIGTAIQSGCEKSHPVVPVNHSEADHWRDVLHMLDG
jgi:hypothetical protein